jgi:hypothetical protein
MLASVVEGVAVEGLLIGLMALACPVGMGLMMWFMGRRDRGPDRR